MTKTEKTLDAVEMMRHIRDQLDEKFAGMSWEEENKYIYEHIRFITLPEKEHMTSTETSSEHQVENSSV